MGEEHPRGFSGPIEEGVWAAKLQAHVVTPGDTPRIHGYAVESDLVRHYSFAESILLALVGELPDETTGRAFEAALHLLAPISIAEAPAHAAALAGLCGASPSGSNQVGAIALAEQARRLIAEQAGLLAALARKEGGAPERYLATSPDDRRAADRLDALLQEIGFRSPLPIRSLARIPGLIAVLYGCGLEAAWQLETALLVARLPCVAAEARAWGPGDFRSYPIDRPPFRYEE